MPETTAWRVLHSDDFSGYASDAEFEAAYEQQPAEAANINWGSNFGPGGIPGVQPTSFTMLSGYGFLKSVDPNCRSFRVKGLFDNSNNPSVGDNQQSPTFVIWNSKPSSANFLEVRDNQLSNFTGVWGDLHIALDTGTGAVIQTIPGVFPINTASTLEVEGRCASAAQGDGYLTIRIDNVIVYSYVGPVSGDQPDWTAVTVIPGGRFSRLEIFDCVAEAATTCADCGPTAGGSASGGGGGTTPGGHSGDPPITHPGPLLPPVDVTAWESLCAGGGVVPTAADLTDAENWDD